MTLVVAQVNGKNISAVSDTGISHNNGDIFPAHKCKPKICILSENIAVGFSGSPELADTAISKCPTVENYHDVVNYFLEFHIQKENGVDFLIMSQLGNPSITKISGGRKTKGPSNISWIGEKIAFDRFQLYRNSENVPTSVSHFERPLMATANRLEIAGNNQTFKLASTLRYVILDRDVHSVFGHPVVISNVDGGFTYRPYAISLDTKPITAEQQASFPDNIVAELDELREFSFSCYVTKPNSHKQGIAYHYMRGNFTYVYYGDRGKPLNVFKLVKDQNADGFIRIMENEGCTDWTGYLLSMRPPSTEDGYPMDRWIEADKETLIRSGMNLKNNKKSK
ncbi:hypothetical protein [Nitrospirillum viridazoti]|uniref:hypothetical protein n=1 Tax=Nitrospirillum viridazoti TaxID=3144925 RepID=UPI0011A022AA|nr:hypothetical protein [Nitrospirillum amazonense]